MNQELALRIGLAVLDVIKQIEACEPLPEYPPPAPAGEKGSSSPGGTTPLPPPKSVAVARRGRPVGSVNTKPYSGRSPGRPRVRPAEETLERNKAYKRAWALENAERIRANRLLAASAAKLAEKSDAATA